MTSVLLKHGGEGRASVSRRVDLRVGDVDEPAAAFVVALEMAAAGFERAAVAQQREGAPVSVDVVAGRRPRPRCRRVDLAVPAAVDEHAPVGKTDGVTRAGGAEAARERPPVAGTAR